MNDIINDGPTPAPPPTWADIVNTMNQMVASLPDLDRIPRRFNCAHDVWVRLHAQFRAQHLFPDPPGGSPASLLGLAITIDSDLEPGAWQILGPNDVLLSDSRSPQ